jgi:hypothetical protein
MSTNHGLLCVTYQEFIFTLLNKTELLLLMVVFL